MDQLLPLPQSVRPQHEFVFYLRRLALLLSPDEQSCTICLILDELRRAVKARSEGAGYADAEGFALRRAEWWVRWGIVDPSNKERAIHRLSTTIRVGMGIFTDIAEHPDKAAMLASVVEEQTGIIMQF
jgi:hypothetical protein